MSGFLDVARKTPRVNHEAIDLYEPCQRVVRQLAGQTPPRVKLSNAKHAHYLTPLRGSRTRADAKRGAQIGASHVRSLRRVEQEVGSADRVNDTACPSRYPTPSQGARPLASQSCREMPSQGGVLFGQMLRTDMIRQLHDGVEPRPRRFGCGILASILCHVSLESA